MYVKYEQRGQIGLITIDRRKVYNALNTELITELGEVLDNVSSESTRALILTGAGEKAFVAGADIAEMQGFGKIEAEKFSVIGSGVFRKLELIPIPVIAAVNGFALGGGCELALACDIRVASENAIFGQPEVTLGITPGYGGTQRLARIVGQSKAGELLYTGGKIDATEALRIGLVSYVYQQNELMDEAVKLAEEICKSAPVAVRMTKKAMTDGLSVGIDDALRLESEYFSQCFETNDQKRAMAAFVEKRKPEPFTNS